MDKHRSEPPNPSLNSTIFIILAKIGRFDESAISGVRSLQPEGIPPETVARCIGLPVEEVKALQENFGSDLSDRGGENLAGEDLTLKLITFKLEFSNFV